MYFKAEKTKFFLKINPLRFRFQQLIFFKNGIKINGFCLCFKVSSVNFIKPPFPLKELCPALTLTIWHTVNENFWHYAQFPLLAKRV